MDEVFATHSALKEAFWGKNRVKPPGDCEGATRQAVASGLSSSLCGAVGLGPLSALPVMIGYCYFVFG